MKIRNNSNLPLLGLFLLLALVFYFTTLNSFFLSDDFELIGRVLADDLSVTWGLEQGGFFRPVPIMTYVTDSALWGTNPLGYHLTNLVLHALNSFFVFILSTRLIRRNSHNPGIAFRISAAAGLIFLLHPSHTEAVSWISARPDLIATLFFLMALIFYDSYREKRASSYLAATLILFILALLSKESALCLPFIIVAIELSPAISQRGAFDLKPTITPAVLLGLIILLYFLIRYAAIGTFIGGYGASHHLNFSASLIWERLPKYALRAVMPPIPEQLSFMFLKPLKSRAFMLLALAFISTLTALLVFRHKRQGSTMRREQNRLLFLMLVSFLFSLLPVITMGINVFDTSGERFVYLGTVFSSIAIAYACATFIANRRIWILAISCLLIFYSVSLHRSNLKWRDAAGLSKSILNDLTGVSGHDDLLVINLPDNLSGVPVYQNGFEQALRIFQRSRKVGHVGVVSSHTLQTATEVLEVVRDANLFSIRLLNEKSRFVKVNDQVRCVGVAERSRYSLTMEFKDCLTATDVFYFQQGKMVEASLTK
jgi:hypothetical protein